jgi:hypothetical protein
LMEPALQNGEKKLSAALRADAENRFDDTVKLRSEAEDAASAISVQIGEMLESRWRDAAPPIATFESQAARRVFKHGEMFLVGRVVDFLREVFPHFRNLMTCTTAAILLTLLAMSSYPFAQHDTLLVLAWLTVLCAMIAMGYVFITMNSDRVLSLLSGSTPGQITWNSSFIAQLLIYGILPLLGLLGVQFPGYFGSILSSFSRSAGGHLS